MAAVLCPLFGLALVRACLHLGDASEMKPYLELLKYTRGSREDNLVCKRQDPQVYMRSAQIDRLACIQEDCVIIMISTASNGLPPLIHFAKTLDLSP